MRNSRVISSRRAVWTSFIVDLSDVVLNLVVAVASGSVVILSQALQGAADLLTSGLLVVGVQQARRRRDRSHRFGYGRELFFWILMSSVTMVAITATFSIYLGAQRLLVPQPIHHLPWAYGVLAIGLVTNLYALSVSLRRLSRSDVAGNLRNLWQRVSRSTYIESKATLVLDAMGSVASVLGILAIGVFQLTGDARFDGLGAIVVGIFTAIFAIMMIVEVKELLVGRSASVETEAAITEAVSSVVGVKRLLDLRTMYLGSERILVNVEVHIDQDLRTAQIERLMDEIKTNVKLRVPQVHHIQVELETPSK